MDSSSSASSSSRARADELELGARQSARPKPVCFPEANCFCRGTNWLALLFPLHLIRARLGPAQPSRVQLSSAGGGQFSEDNWRRQTSRFSAGTRRAGRGRITSCLRQRLRDEEPSGRLRASPRADSQTHDEPTHLCASSLAGCRASRTDWPGSSGKSGRSLHPSPLRCCCCCCCR